MNWPQGAMLGTKDRQTGGIPSDADFAKFATRLAGDIDSVTRRMIEQDISPSDWYTAFDSVILQGHTEAVVLGRQRAGDLRDFNEFDRLLGVAARDQQSPFLLGFLDDLEFGKYRAEDGSLDEAWIRRRAQMYAGATRGTANLSWLAVGDPNDLVWWRTSPAEHCPDCLEWAAQNPYQRQTLAIVPGDGSTQCVTNCRCWLEDEQGNTGFKSPF